jgi:SAM-dependent methyltransferase
VSATSTSAPPAGTEAATCPACGSASCLERRIGEASLRRCERCGFTFVPQPEDRSLYGDAYFESYSGGDYVGHEARRRHESRVRLDLLATVLPPPARLLEIGAAAGFFLDEARRRGYSGVGIEPNAAMAAHARETLGLGVRAGTLQEQELEPGAFDGACAFHVIEHLADPLSAVSRLRAALRPGGFLFIEVPNAQSTAAERRGAAWPPLDLPYHLGHFGPSSLRALLERAGLEVVLVDTIPFAIYGASSRIGVLARGAAEALRARAAQPPGPHPSGHQLLRVLARAPA